MACENELRIILLGNTGAGKSATGNSILMTEAFTEDDDPVAGTYHAASVTGDPLKEGRRISVTDTPGLYSTSISDKMMNKIVFNFIAQIAPGPHAILIVISTKSRVTPDIQSGVKALCEIFGKNSTDYVIFVFTHIDQLRGKRGRPPTSITEWVDKLVSQNLEMGKIIKERCKGRYVAFNNNLKETSEENKAQVESLLDCITSTLEQNGNEPLTSKEIQEVEDMMKELDEKTGSRPESRKLLPDIVGIASVVCGAAVVSIEGAAAIEVVGATILGAAIGTAAASTAGAAFLVGGFSILAWNHFKKNKEKTFKETGTAVKKFKPKP